MPASARTEPPLGSRPALAKMLRRWRAEILAHHATGASNGPVEAANLTIKQIKRSGRGFRNLDNYRLRILLTGQRDLRQTQPVTSIRARRPRLIAERAAIRFPT